MSQIRAKLGMVFCLLLVVITFIPSASSKYVKSYPIDLSLKTVLAQGKLYWTDKAGEMPDVYTFPSAEDKANFQDGYYMIIAKGGNGADSNGHPGGYGGVVSSIISYNPSSGNSIVIALGSSADEKTCGYNALDTYAMETTQNAVLRGGSYSNAFAGGAGTTVFVGVGYNWGNLLLLAGGGGAGNYQGSNSTTSFSGGAGGGNVVNATNSSNVTLADIKFYCYSGQTGAAQYGGYGGRDQSIAKYYNTSYGAGESMWSPIGGGNGGPVSDSGFLCCGGAGYYGGTANDTYGAAGGGSSLISRNSGLGYQQNADFSNYITAMKNLIAGDDDGIASKVVLNESNGMLYVKGSDGNSTGKLSNISFVGIYYMGTTLE